MARAALVASCVAAAFAWEELAQPPWDAHTGSIAVTLQDDSMLMIAGQKGEHGGALFDCFNCTNEVWRYEPEQAKWTNESADVPWDPRWGHSAVAVEGKVWMLFGCCERGKPTVMLRDVWTWTPGGSWLQQETDPPFDGLQGTSVAVLKDEIWVVGGWSQWKGTLSLVAALSTKTLEWKKISPHGAAPWKHRADHCTAISPGGEWLFLHSGQHRDETTGNWFRLKDTWRVALPDAKAAAWTQLGDLTAARSSPPVLILPSGWLLALGGHYIGEDEHLQVNQSDVEGMKEHHEKTPFTVYNDVLALDMKTGGQGGWQEVERGAPWKARDDFAAAVTKTGSVFIFGGGTVYGGGGYLQDAWKLSDPAKFYTLGGQASAAAGGSDEL